MHDDIKWLLERIQSLSNKSNPDTPSHWPIHKNIWRGSYDVWSCDQDRIDAVEIPNARMREAEETGLIESKLVQWKKWDFTVWSLTEKGEQVLSEGILECP